MTMLQKVIAQIILASRYILVIFYVGLAAALLVYAGRSWSSWPGSPPRSRPPTTTPS